MIDPYDRLREELLAAATRAELGSPKRRWAWWRGRSRPLVVVVAALVVCGSAAAAVVSLSARSSQPLSGRVPGRVAPFSSPGPVSVAGNRYSIQVTPLLSTGSSGWAVWTAYTGPALGGSLGGGGGGGYPTRADPIFQGGGVAPWSIPIGSTVKGDSVGFVVTGPQVAAVRVAGRTIRTFSSSLLPVGDRAAVFFLASHGPLPAVGWRPGQPINASLRIPVIGPRARVRMRSVASTAVLPLDTSGQILPTVFPADSGYLRGWSFWQAPTAVTPKNHEPPYHGRTRPRPGACMLAQHDMPGLTAEWGSTTHTIPTVTDSLGELFVSCVSTEYYLHGWPMVAAILLDARHPGSSPGPIPGTHPVAGQPKMVDFPSASLTARRVGAAWLVVQGGSGTTQRLRVLHALQITKLDLPHHTR